MVTKPKLYFFKVLELPDEPHPDSIYLVKGDSDTYTMYVTDSQGAVTRERTRVIPTTQNDLNSLANTNSLNEGELWYLTDQGRLAVPTSSSEYNQFYAFHVGPTPPDDTSVIWFDTSSFV